jgi:hypothetical protein
MVKFDQGSDEFLVIFRKIGEIIKAAGTNQSILPPTPTPPYPDDYQKQKHGGCAVVM